MAIKRYTVEEAQKAFSKVIAEAQRGETVYITRDGKPVVKVLALNAGLKKRVLGSFEGKTSWTPDAFDLLTDEEMGELGFE
jgi:prevent-host-death family protein